MCVRCALAMVSFELIGADEKEVKHVIYALRYFLNGLLSKDDDEAVKYLRAAGNASRKAQDLFLFRNDNVDCEKKEMN